MVNVKSKKLNEQWKIIGTISRRSYDKKGILIICD